jgi:hypothetical protein
VVLVHCDDGTLPIWVAKDRNGKVIAIRVYTGTSDAEDMAMIGLTRGQELDSTSHVNSEFESKVSWEPADDRQQMLQDIHMQSMLLEQQQKKLLLTSHNGEELTAKHEGLD